uniref:Oxysterol-binding protein n=1 Tax=Gasterosteus aculeatus aculeatus TaxID=481459 RepID=A0AAQ4PA84_GASAC
STGRKPLLSRSLYRSSLMSLLLTVSLCLPLSSCRYFVLDSEDGQLQYHLNELSKGQRPPRGSVPLLGAMVVSCDEYPYMFTIRSTSGDAYKLRAIDAQEQELWMTQLQLCTRRRSESSAKVFTHSHTHHPPPPGYISLSGFSLAPPGKNLQRRFVGPLDDKRVRTFERGFCVEPFTHGSRYNHRCWILSGTLAHLLSFLSFPSPSIKDLLIFKATSAATLSCLGECLSMLQHNVCLLSWTLHTLHKPSYGFFSSSASQRGVFFTNSHVCLCHQGQQQAQTSSPEALDPCDEVTDTDDNEEEDLGVLDDQRSIMLHLLSQLKLGMDLTRVVLPTFILEKRSLLEMYANFMAHPDMFLSITSGCTPEERIVRFVEYYLTAFHEGRKGAVAKKPYNPILGENFHCSWYVPRDRRGADGSRRANADCYCVRFVAEQVSHHPPVSGFYCECKEKRMCVNTHVWTKSKFLGMSVGVSMVGEGVLYLLEHDEEYVFTLPCAYARSILTVPWVELGGKVTINCAKSGYSATVTFHTKPFYGGKVHRVTAEVKHNQTGNVVCKAQGEWNGVLEFTYSNGETKAIDTSKQPIIKKKILPPEKQGPYESRRLWQHVTASLKSGNMDAATEHKHRLEERQRKEGKQRAATKTPWKPKYFIKEGEGWVYHNPLWKAH